IPNIILHESSLFLLCSRRHAESMTTPARSADAALSDLADLADDAVALVRQWLVESREIPVDAAGQRLAGVLRDPHGLDFTVGFVDGVVRPEDTRVAARRLAELVPLTPRFLPAPMRAAIGLGGAPSTMLPGIVVPAARAVLRQMVR